MLENIFNKIIRWSFYLLFFLVPLILTPWNYELFEFNKMLLTYALAGIILSAWVGKMILKREIRIQRTPLDIPILLYLISAVLSTIYSIEPHTSLWGYYSRSNGGLLSIISYIVLYYAFVTNIDNGQMAKWLNDYRKNKSSNLPTIKPFNHLTIIYILLFSASLVSLYGILEHFGIDSSFWIQDVKNRVFSTMGQPNWLGAFIDSLIFIPLALALSNTSFAPLSFRARSKTKRGNLSSDCRVAALLAMTTAKFVSNKNKSKSPLLFTFYSLLFLCLLFTNSKSSILAFFIGLGIFSILMLIFNFDKWKQLAGVWIFTLVFYLLLGSNTYSYLKKTSSWLNTFSGKQIVQSTPNNQITKKPIYTDVLFSESSEIRKVVWTGAVKVWQNYPLLGSGLETFAYSYYNFRPKEHNLLSEWDFLYNKAHNEFLNILACQGLLGIISYLLIIVIFIFWCLNKVHYLTRCSVRNNAQSAHRFPFTANKITKNHDFSISKMSHVSLLISLFTGYLTILITNFFGFSVVIISLLFFLIPAFCFSLCGELRNQNSYKLIITWPIGYPIIRYSLLLIIVFTLSSWLFTLVKVWRADFYFSRGEKYYEANYLVDSFFDLQKATQLNPQEPTFHSYLAQNSAKLALVYQVSQASDSAKMIKDLTDLAVWEAKTSVTLNPVHLNFWRSNATTFIYLAQIDNQYRTYAINSLEEAIKIAPTDPKNYYNLGVTYNQWENLSEAENALKKAIELKPNYRSAYIELANLYEKQKQYAKVSEQIDFILNFIDPHDKFSLDMKEKLKKL